MVGLIENSGFGGHHAAPAIRGVYDAFYRKTRHQEPPGTLPKPQIAKQETPNKTKPATTAVAQQQGGHQ
jgi:hypothetical protein